MQRRNTWVRAILAVPLCLIASVQEFSPEADTRSGGEVPRPEELLLLEELAAWDWQEPPRQGAAAADLASALASRAPGFGSDNHLELVVSLPYGEEILETARRHALDSLLVAAVVEAESSFDAAAVSPRGAVGLMQVMPPLARSYGIVDASDPRLNLEAGSRYLGSLLRRFDGDVGLALAAYNAGPSRVVRYGGVPPYPETTRYVRRVLRRYLEHHSQAWRGSWSAPGQWLPAADAAVPGAASADGLQLGSGSYEELF